MKKSLLLGLVALTLIVLSASRRTHADEKTTDKTTDKPIPVYNIRDAFGEDLWNKLKQYYYQTLFDDAGDINTSIYSNSYLNVHLQEGRLLLTEDPTHVMLADHFGITTNENFPIGHLLSVGGSLGAYLLRIRQLPDLKSAEGSVTLHQDLRDWDPNKRLADPSTFQQNIGPWIDSIAADVQAGNTDGAHAIFGDEPPQEQYLDLLAGLKLPFEMPWTAKRLLDGKKFLNGDLASFVAQGGIFARLGGQGIGWENIAGPWAGIFLNGQFRFGILKLTPAKYMLRIDSEKDSGFNWNAFDDDFRIPLGHGLIFGHGINPSTGYKPFTIAGMSYNSKLFARTYGLDFTFAGVAGAYDAAVHGNLTVLDDMAKTGGQGVEVLCKRYNNGHYNISQFQFHFGPLQINNMYSNGNTEEDFWDERGTFKYFTANSIRTDYIDVNLLAFQVRQTRSNTLTTEAYPVAPKGPFPPRMVWNFDEVNLAATKSDQQSLQTFIESLKPTSNTAKNVDLSKYTKFHADFQLQIHPQGINDFESHNSDDVWKSAGQILFNDATLWQDEKARENWLDNNPDADMTNYDQVEHWANAFKHKPDASDFKKWFGNLIEWQRSSHWDVLGVRLFLSMVSRENRYMKLEFTPAEASQAFTYQDGTFDISAYPDDWEYMTIPNIEPQMPPRP